MADTDGNEWVLLDTDLTARLAILPSAMSHLYFVLNEPGSGELKIPLESNAAALIESGQFAQASYRGGARGGFFVDNIQKQQADASEGGGKWLSISGRGGLALLEDAIVWDDGTTASTREFASMTKAAILITLIDEAQARGGLAALTYDFSATDDSDSVAWTDSESYQLSVGTSLLDVLRQFAKTGIDFDIVYSSGSFVLSAYKNGKGTDKSETIYFRTGVNCEEVKSDERGDAIKNALRVAYKAGNVTITDSTSITNRRRREKLLDARVAQTAASATTYGSAILANSKDPRKGISVKIYDGVGPRVFLDYDLGDYIMLDVEGTETSYRVLGIQLDWDGKDYSNVVVELNSLLYENEIRMAQDIDWLLDQWETARDADLLEVSYWAAIGDPNIALSIVAMLTIGTKIYYLGTGSSGNLVSYETTTGTWETLISYGGLDTPYCMTLIGTDLYIGTSAAVYKYATSTSTLTNIGSITVGDPEIVYCITAVGTDIYIGGVFSAVDGVAANDLAKYDTLTDTWTAGMGSGVTGIPLVMLTSGTDVYMGGTFTAVDGVSASKVAKWNGSTWAALDAGLDFTVYSLAVYGTNILAGGDFTGKISEWNGSAWATFGGGVGDIVRGIAVYLTDVYIVGDFTDVGNYIARYSGGAWWELGTGLNASTTDIVLIDDDVYVGGNFTTAGDKPASKVAAYFNNFESLVDYLENSSSSFNMGAAIHAATASAITDSDEVPFWEDVANALRKITWANIKATLKTYFDTLYVALTGNQTIAGVKTFSSDPIIPDEAYDATAWNGVLEPPTKNAVRDKIETVGLPAGSNLQVQINNGGVFGADDEFEYTLGGQIISLGRDAGAEASAVWSWQTGGVSFHNLASWGTGNYSSMRGILARGTKASPTAAQADDIGMRFRGSAYDGVGLVLSSATGAEIRFVANENQSATNHGMRAEIWTTPDGSTTETKVFTIGANGQVAVLSTTDSTSYLTGALLVSGGVGIAKSVSINGNVGIGQAASASAGLFLLRTATDTSGAMYGLNGGVFSNPASASSTSVIGAQVTARTNVANAQNHTGTIIGGLFTAFHRGSGTASSLTGGRFSITNDGGGTVTDAITLSVLSATNSSGTITNNYGLLINNQTAGGTLNYAIYTGTGLVRFGDAVSSTGSILSSNATTGIGYTTGAGGTVTQATNKATGVTLNKATGLITMNNAALAADTTVTFTLTSSAIAATDTIILNHASAGTAGAYTLNAQVAAGSATINVRNVTAGSLSEAIVIRYTVIKSISA